MRRILACQGSAQLLTAVAAARFRASRQGGARPQDSLVIYDVSPEFARFIERLAKGLGEWEKIVYLTDENFDAGIDLLALTGIAHVDEIFLCRNFQRGNERMLAAYPDARKIAYGDGIGYYFGPDRFLPPVQRNAPLLRRLARSLIPGSWRAKGASSIPFDEGYFLLPEIFGEKPPMPFEVPPKQFLEGVLADAARALPEASSLGVPTGGELVIFLVGRYAPAWTDLASELNAYRELLESKVKPGATLVVKPHPRSTPEEIAEFRRVLSPIFPNFRVLEAPLTFVPMEVLARNGLNPASTRIFSFTTAFIPLKILYNIPCEIGFGDELLRKTFREPALRKHMEKNETLLRQIAGALEREQTF